MQSKKFREVSIFICRSDVPSSTWSFLWHQSLSCRCKGMATGFGNKRSSLRFSEKSPHHWCSILSEKPCISSLAAFGRHLKRNDRCDRKTQKKCRKRERQRGEETRTSLLLLEPQMILIQGDMTTNIYITQTWWRLLSAVGSTLITLVAWLGYMAIGLVGEVILGVMKFIFGILISVISVVVLIGTFIWLLTL